MDRPRDGPGRSRRSILRARRSVQRTILSLTVGTALLAVPWTPLAGAVATAAPAPSVGLTTNALVLGHSVMVTGQGWAPYETFQATVCGNNANDGSTDCAVQATSTFAAFTDGTLHGVLQVETPPVPCPCVVQVIGTANGYSADLPVTIAGVPTGPVTPPPTAGATKVTAHATVTGGASWGSRFGGRADRTLVVTVHNAGTTSVEPVVSAEWGKSPQPTNLITSSPPILLAPGATRTVRMPFSLDPLSFGTYLVTGHLSGTSPEVSFASTTSTSPWALPLVLLVVLVLLLAALFWRRRGRDQQVPEVPETYGPGHAAPGLDALAAMSAAALVGTDGGACRILDLLLISQDGESMQAVPVAQFAMDSKGIGVTNPRTLEVRLLSWGSIRGVEVAPWPGLLGDEGESGAPGTLITVEAVYTIYRFVAPGRDPADLVPPVTSVARLWIKPASAIGAKPGSGAVASDDEPE